MGISRREFMGASAVAVLAAGAFSRSRVFGANERIAMACCGINGRGNEHIQSFFKTGQADIVALVDPDERVLERQAKNVERMSGGNRPKTYTDIREALQDSSIDAISIATPNHWHTLMTIWACQAGKDVYVEKPATHNLYEGKQLQAAAKKYNRIVQHGTQRRSEANWIRDIKLLQSGEIIGPLYMARGLCYKNGNRGDIGIHPDSEPPSTLHWDLWQGPASRKPFNKAYHPYTWHWFWHYGNGEIGNQGIHQLDVAVWGMNKGFPVKVSSEGGRYTYKDMGETPNTNIATFTYADGTMLVFEVRNRFTNDEAGVRVGNLFYGNEGYYVEDKGFFDTKDKPIPIDNAKYPITPTQSCWQNFINSVRDRKQEGIYGNVLDAHYSSGHAHLANTAYRLGRTLHFDPATETYKNDEEANGYLSRQYAEGFEVPNLA